MAALAAGLTRPRWRYEGIDRGASQAAFAVIKDDELSGCHRALRPVERDFDRAVVAAEESTRLVGLPVADFRRE